MGFVSPQRSAPSPPMASPPMRHTILLAVVSPHHSTHAPALLAFPGTAEGLLISNSSQEAALLPSGDA